LRQVNKRVVPDQPTFTFALVAVFLLLVSDAQAVPVSLVGQAGGADAFVDVQVVGDERLAQLVFDY